MWLDLKHILFNNSTRKILVSTCSMHIANNICSSPMFLLGYMPSHNRIYLADQGVNIFGYALSLALVEYQTAILRGDMDAAAEILPTVPADQRNKVARFLESQGKFKIPCTLTLPRSKPRNSLQISRSWRSAYLPTRITSSTLQFNSTTFLLHLRSRRKLPHQKTRPSGKLLEIELWRHGDSH